MGIESQLKQISIPTLETLRQNPSIVSSFFAAKWLPESAFWQRATYFTGESAQKTKQEARARFGRVPQNRNRWIGSYDRIALEEQFLSEWETPELDLHKNFQGLNFLLAGYIPGHVSSKWTIPELRAFVGTQSQKPFLSSLIQALVGTQSPKDFLSFFAIENSQWDGLPLVNAIGAGNEIGYETGYG
ncbi:hypothetical protein ACE1CD_21895 [Aerosakkonema sp. BLCC-F183]|uniref:hypothetical protein n=1 Tax=Aerosakkonema sp. BLCC-F183 TaxID=3342834 RepID=UPI0035B722CA